MNLLETTPTDVGGMENKSSSGRVVLSDLSWITRSILGQRREIDRPSPVNVFSLFDVFLHDLPLLGRLKLNDISRLILSSLSADSDKILHGSASGLPDCFCNRSSSGDARSKIFDAPRNFSSYGRREELRNLFLKNLFDTLTFLVILGILLRRLSGSRMIRLFAKDFGPINFIIVE